MELIIEFIKRGEFVKLNFANKESLIDSFDLMVNSSFDTMLIEAIDKFLLKNRINMLFINKVRVGGNFNENSTSYKVAQAVQAALNNRIKALSHSKGGK